MLGIYKKVQTNHRGLDVRNDGEVLIDQGESYVRYEKRV